jgi:S1-C subfamily serine protease/predicted TPR repeat methyltransferase
MRSTGLFGLAVLTAALTSTAAPQKPPTGSPTPSASPDAITNPNTTPAPAQPQQGVVAFDVKKLAGMSRPAVALITVLDKDGKLVKSGSGFFVSADGKLVTNAHVIEGAASANAKLENGAPYSIQGVLKPAIEKDLLLLQADAKDVPYLTVSDQPMPDVGSRVAVIGSPFGLEGTVSEGIVSGHRDAKKDDQWLQMTAAVSPGSSGSPVVDENGKVVGVATFVVHNAQALNFARPVVYVSQLLDQAKSITETAPLWTVVSNPKNVILNDPDFIEAESKLQKGDAAGALKILNTIKPKYPENETLLFKFGAVYERLNLLDDAVQEYQHALKLEPTSGIGWTNLGGALEKLKRFADAKEAAKQAVKLSPDFGPAWALLGKLYSQENRYSDAADAFQKAAQLMPKDAEFWGRLAESYSKTNQTAKSQEAINKSQEITGATPIARANPVSPRKDGLDSSVPYRDLVTGALHAFEQRDIDAILSTYSEKVVYRGYGVVDRAFIRKDLEDYFARWPATQVQLKGPIRVFDTQKPDEKRVVFAHDFHATSPERHAWSAGSAWNEWWVWETPEGLKVFGQKQKITKRQKNP